MPWLLMASEEFPFTDIRSRKQLDKPWSYHKRNFCHLFCRSLSRKNSPYKEIKFQCPLFSKCALWQSCHANEDHRGVTAQPLLHSELCFCCAWDYSTWKMSVQRKSCCAYCLKSGQDQVCRPTGKLFQFQHITSYQLFARWKSAFRFWQSDSRPCFWNHRL